ncbi:tetraprenyl-beta-curcumene synthase family protein [Virgibacillus sp. 179-BFC.A HS]|uniref:Tetraprenyl-beta-curcumene synthase family protein n=1 Tax=Tigheibacillus jepli TaxID=3035914 RepID=A0ABU5CG46_9BACI|nr:tetraprenyl-beta-curcumene synthase family protein [Virgibacillus sp. 179-BFC.A HS]MDY0405283.1 tetraprenyl-beta-curcumene synthase family protein [Virgibacillus sp. 179-BFC.A HS]
MKSIPENAISLMAATYREVFPEVNRQLNKWENLARSIPDPELRRQALASIESKRFHCQGGAVFALLAGERYQMAIRFIVAYQTISDYLDNLCDRSTSLDAADFHLLHEAMHDALSPGEKIKNYYALRKEQDDGNYLGQLVQTCQQVLEHISEYKQFQEQLLNLEGLYRDLQVHKHVKLEERVLRLKRWYQKHKHANTGLQWQEFAAASGSTLGIFCIVSYSLKHVVTEDFAKKIVDAYFPYVQGLHILLDYYIDQQEDKQEGDLNFCSYYASQEEMHERFHFFAEQADKRIEALPDTRFHLLVRRGLIGLYLSDPKVKDMPDETNLKQSLLYKSGVASRFFHWNAKTYYCLKRKQE